MHRAGLRTFVALCFLEAHFVAGGELVERAVGEAVAMEVQQSAGVGRDAAKILSGEQFGDIAGRRLLMNFDLTALATSVLLQLAAHGVEGIAERDININVGMVLGGLARRDQCLIGHGDINAHAVMIAVLMVLIAQRAERDEQGLLARAAG